MSGERISEQRWIGTTCLREKPVAIDKSAGIIKGCKVCSAGEAKGHGVFLDKEFIDTVAEQGNASKRGLKARFGHPNMCSESLGTYIGKFTNFSTGTTVRNDGEVAACCFADLHLSETAKDSPNGDLHAYVMSMAENAADMFGTSIVFSRGSIYRRNQHGAKVYPRMQDGTSNPEYESAGGVDFIECKKLIACDCVDEPAANDGLFSTFSGEIVAGKITEFLDLHPHVFEIIEQSPEIVAAVAKHGKRFDQFLTRYRAYRSNVAPEKESNMDVLMLKENHPDLVAAIRTEALADTERKLAAARKEGADGERARIQEVLQQVIPGHEALVEQLAFDGSTSGPQAAVQVLAAERVARKTGLERFTTKAPLAVPAALSGGDTAKSKEDLAKATWESDAALRAEFAQDFDTYLAYIGDVPGVRVRSGKQ